MCCCAVQASPLNLENQVATLEETWRAGTTNEYYNQASVLADKILVLGEITNVMPASAQLLLSLVSKESNPREFGAEDLWIMKKMAWYLTCNANIANEDLRANAVILSKFMGKIRNDKIPDYQWKRVTANVGPPWVDPGTRNTNRYPDKYPGRYSGMDPAAIGDPYERSLYEEAIRKNQQNNNINKQQRALNDLERYFLKSIMDYIVRAFGDSSAEELDKCMEDARLTEEEKAAVRNGIIEEKARAAAIEAQIEQPQPVRKIRR